MVGGHDGIGGFLLSTCCCTFLNLLSFNDSVSGLDFKTSNERLLVNTELERIWKEVVMV